MSGGAECELCAADRFTHWYFEDEICWVADCEACSVPMVVWKHHGTDPDDAAIEHMHTRLAEAAVLRFGNDLWQIDGQMRQVPSHFHAHARDRDWLQQRMQRPLSRYTSVGGPRVEARPFG